MDVREKLVELLREAPYNIFGNKLGNCYFDSCLELIANHLIAHGVTAQEWISVEDRLPTREDANETESILAINKDEKYVGRWVWDIVARWPTEFTYWMPIPQPPKGE